MPRAISILSAGAVAPGLLKVSAAFQSDASHDVEIAFATAPELRKRIAAGELVEIVIAPADLLDELTKSGKADADPVTVGRIGVGVMVRRGVMFPQIATVEELKQTLSNSESIVYNQASTGLYIDNLFKQLGIAAQLENKITRCADFTAVRERIASGHANAIGFGATTVIAESAGQGVTLVGPLPAELQNYTSYAAALTASANDDAKAFLDYLASPAARAILKSLGID